MKIKYNENGKSYVVDFEQFWEGITREELNRIEEHYIEEKNLWEEFERAEESNQLTEFYKKIYNEIKNNIIDATCMVALDWTILEVIE